VNSYPESLWKKCLDNNTKPRCGSVLPIGTLDQIFEMPNQCPIARDGLLSEIHVAWLYLSLCGLSMTQNVQATVNQHSNSISNPQISTSSQGMPRSSNVHIVLQITTKGFSWSYGTQLWTAPPLPRGNCSLLLPTVDSNKQDCNSNEHGQKPLEIHKGKKKRSDYKNLRKCTVYMYMYESLQY